MSVRYCPKCGAEQGPEARFCWSCGDPIAAAAAVAAPPRRPETPAAPAVAAPQRSPAAETVVFEMKPLAIRTMRECLFSILTLGIGWLCYRVARMGHTYVLTTQRVEIRQGIVTKRRNTLDLFRVEDFEVLEPFFLRMRAAGNIRIWSMDRSEPEFVLEAVPGVHAVYEKLRELTRDERRRNQVRLVEGI